MAKTLGTTITKGIFQVMSKPEIESFQLLFKKSKLNDYFLDWETDRLSIQLKDYRKHHSVVLKIDSFTYETDEFKKDEFDKVMSLSLSEAKWLLHKPNIIRIGYRLHSLIDIGPMTFDDIVNIVNVKTLNSDFIDLFGKPVDNTLTLIMKVSDSMNCRMIFGPMLENEIPRFFQLNINQHYYKGEGGNRIKDCDACNLISELMVPGLEVIGDNTDHRQK